MSQSRPSTSTSEERRKEANELERGIALPKLCFGLAPSLIRRRGLPGVSLGLVRSLPVRFVWGLRANHRRIVFNAGNVRRTVLMGAVVRLALHRGFVVQAKKPMQHSRYAAQEMTWQMDEPTITTHKSSCVEYSFPSMMESAYTWQSTVLALALAQLLNGEKLKFSGS